MDTKSSDCTWEFSFITAW